MYKTVTHRSSSRRQTRFATAILLASLVVTVGAHEIPHDVSIVAHVAPQPDGVHVLVRAPFEAMRDIELPLEGPGYLRFGADLDAALIDAAELWIAGGLTLSAGGRSLGDPDIRATRISLPSDRSFDSFDAATAHFETTGIASELLWHQALFETHLVYPANAEIGTIELVPAWAHLGVRTRTAVTFALEDGSVRRVSFEGDPGTVAADPAVTTVAAQFLALGTNVFFASWDHVLLVVCLVVALGGVVVIIRSVVALLGGFALSLGGFSLAVDPGPLWMAVFVSAAVAVSLVIVCCMNVFALRERGATKDRPDRSKVAYVAGLLQGYVVAQALAAEWAFAGDHPGFAYFAFLSGFVIWSAIFAVVVSAVTGVLRSRRLPGSSDRAVVVIVSVLIAHTAWHWLLSRADILIASDRTWLSIAFGLQWTTFGLVAVLVFFALRFALDRWMVVD